MNVTFSWKSNNFKENIDSFLVSLFFWRESCIFFFIFRWDGTLFFHSPRESLYLFIRHCTIKHASDMRRDYSVYFESVCLPLLRLKKYSQLHHRYVLNGHNAQTVLILDLCLSTVQSHQCSVFGMSKLTSCRQQAVESRMVLRSDSESWSCPPCRLTRILRQLAINGVHCWKWFDGHPSHKHRDWIMWLCFTNKGEQILNSCRFEVKSIQSSIIPDLQSWQIEGNASVLEFLAVIVSE